MRGVEQKDGARVRKINEIQKRRGGGKRRREKETQGRLGQSNNKN